MFDGDRSPATGAEVRDYHIPIKGGGRSGTPLQRAQPRRLLLGPRNVFFMGTVLTAEYFGDGLTEDQKRQLFDEHVTWYRMYGMSMRPVPASWEEFQLYWDHMCRNVLENNWATREVLDLSTMPKHPSLQWIPDFLWSAYLKALGPFAVWITVGLYGQPVRDLMGYTWSKRDERLHRLFGRMVNLAFKRCPSVVGCTACACGLGSCDRPHSRRRTADPHAGPQSAADRGARQGNSLPGRHLPDQKNSGVLTVRPRNRP